MEKQFERGFLDPPDAVAWRSGTFEEPESSYSGTKLWEMMELWIDRLGIEEVLHVLVNVLDFRQMHIQREVADFHYEDFSYASACMSDWHIHRYCEDILFEAEKKIERFLKKQARQNKVRRMVRKRSEAPKLLAKTSATQSVFPETIPQKGKNTESPTRKRP